MLEQVEDVQIALSELGRVVCPGTGELIVSVGIDAREKTLEFGFRDKALSGNRRSFGADFAQTLAASGFEVSPVPHNLSAEECRKYGIAPEPFYRCIRN